MIFQRKYENEIEAKATFVRICLLFMISLSAGFAGGNMTDCSSYRSLCRLYWDVPTNNVLCIGSAIQNLKIPS